MINLQHSSHDVTSAYRDANMNINICMFSQRELAELDKLREDYVTSKADELESRDEDMLGED